MKFIGFFGKGKDAAEPVLEYHPPCENGGYEEEDAPRSSKQLDAPWEKEDESDYLDDELEEAYAEAGPSVSPTKPKSKKSGKRQLVMAALVMALGAAVYLNWQFSGDQQLLATDALSSEKEIGTAQLVNGEAGEKEEEAAAQQGETLAQAKLSRQKARDEAVELLEQVLKDAASSDEAKKEAVTQSATIAQNVLQESNIENLVKAKGYSDCVAVIQNGECSVIISGALQNESDAVVIQDIVTAQTSFEPSKIKIVEAK